MPLAGATPTGHIGPMFAVTVLTLFPDIFPGPLDASVLGRARGEGRWTLDMVNIRDFSDNKYGSVDDAPAGGGAGLVMRADILAAALDSVSRAGRPALALTPRGAPFTQERARALSEGPGLIAICGRFEGVDERLFEARSVEPVSIGDFVLAGGEIAAMAMIEACLRLRPGVLGSASSLGEESFEGGLLEYPQYARPRDFEGHKIPEILLSGDHGAIAEWRRARAEEITRARRPDLWAAYEARMSGPIRRTKKNKDDAS